MNDVFIVLLMIFCHIVDDYCLQGILASMKQKDFWKKNAPDEMYRYDYIWALIMHSFSWAFMIMLPIAYSLSFDVNIAFLIAFVVNVAVHAITDDLKANKRKINLWVDQLIHMGQIAVTAIVLL